MPEATNSYEPPLNPHYRQRAVFPLQNGDLELSLPGWLCVRDVDSIESFFALLVEQFREDATPSHARINTPAYTLAPHASGAKADDPDAVVKKSLTTQADGRISK